MKKIGQVVEALAISADTLRYYEKIGLMPRVHRGSSGLRFYSDKDLSRLRFIRRAQKMGFSLAEIADLLRFRDNPRNDKPQVRALAHRKLTEIEKRLTELSELRDELALSSELCADNPDGCPILESFDQASGCRKSPR